jgi:hypothetical protein
MKTFTIENETNNITIHATKQEAEAVPDAERFANEAALAKLAADWPMARLVDIWNSLPGETPVKKFKDRATAVSRIWKAIQRLGQTKEEAVVAPAAPQTPHDAPVEAPAKTKASRTKKADVAADSGSGPREGSKTSRVIELLKREGGVTLKELMIEMGWQSHTTRALMSAGGSLAKKHGLTVVSAKGENGDRVYSLQA